MLAPGLSTDGSELKYMTREHGIGSVLENVSKPEPTPERLSELFSKLDLIGIQDWPDNL